MMMLMLVLMVKLLPDQATNLDLHQPPPTMPAVPQVVPQAPLLLELVVMLVALLEALRPPVLQQPMVMACPQPEAQLPIPAPLTPVQRHLLQW